MIEVCMPTRIWPNSSAFRVIRDEARKNLWYCEPKMNGWRCIVEKDEAAEPAFTSRHGSSLDQIVDPQIREWARQLPNYTVLDAELLTSRRGGDRPEGVSEKLYVFDIVEYFGEDVRRRVIEDRHQLLLRLLQSDAILIPKWPFTPDIQTEYDAAVVRGDEGIVVKRARSLYNQRGSWIKVKAHGK